MIELDKRIKEYLNGMIRDIDLLMVDTANLNDEQRAIIQALKMYTGHYLSFYTDMLPYFEDFEIGSRTYIYDMRGPLSHIRGYCDVLYLPDEWPPLNDTQQQLLQQINTALELIIEAFTTWAYQKKSK